MIIGNDIQDVLELVEERAKTVKRLRQRAFDLRKKPADVLNALVHLHGKPISVVPLEDGSVVLSFPDTPLLCGSRPTDCIRSAGWVSEYWEKVVRGRITVPGKSRQDLIAVEDQALQMIRRVLTGEC